MNRTLTILLALTMFAPILSPVVGAQVGEPEPPVEVNPPADLPEPGDIIDAEQAQGIGTYFEDDLSSIANWTPQQLVGDKQEDSLWRVGPFGANGSLAATLTTPTGLPRGLHQALVSPEVDLTPVPGAEDDGTADRGAQIGVGQADDAVSSAPTTGCIGSGDGFTCLKDQARQQYGTVGTVSLPQGPAYLTLIHRFLFEDARNEADEALSGFTIEARSGGEWVPLEPLATAKAARDTGSPATSDAANAGIDDSSQIAESTLPEGVGPCLAYDVIETTYQAVNFGTGESGLTCPELFRGPAGTTTVPTSGDDALTTLGSSVDIETTMGAAGQSQTPTPTIYNAHIAPLDARGFTGETPDSDDDGRPDAVGHIFDLSPWAGEEVELRFRAGTTAVTEVPGGFWAIDHVEVRAGARTADLRLELTGPGDDHIAPPEQTFPLTAEIQNVGISPQEGPFDVEFTVARGGTPVRTEVVTVDQSLGFLESAEATLPFTPTKGAPYTVQAALQPGNPDTNPQNDQSAGPLPVGVDRSVSLRVLPNATTVEAGSLTEASVFVESRSNVPLEGTLTLTAFPYDAATESPVGSGSIVMGTKDIALPADDDRHPAGIDGARAGASFERRLDPGPYLLVAEFASQSSTAPLGVATPAPPILDETYSSIETGPTTFEFRTPKGTWNVDSASDVLPRPIRIEPGSTANGSAWVPIPYDSTLVEPQAQPDGSGQNETLAHRNVPAGDFVESVIREGQGFTVCPPQIDPTIPVSGNVQPLGQVCGLLGETNAEQTVLIESPQGTQRLYGLATDVPLEDVDEATLRFASQLITQPGDNGATQLQVYVSTKQDTQTLAGQLSDPENCPEGEACELAELYLGLAGDIANVLGVFQIEDQLRCEVLQGIDELPQEQLELICPQTSDQQEECNNLGGLEATTGIEGRGCLALDRSNWEVLSGMLSGDLVYSTADAHGWQWNEADLSAYAGQDITLTFILLSDTQTATADGEADSEAEFFGVGPNPEAREVRMGIGEANRPRGIGLLDRITVATDAGLKLSPQDRIAPPSPFQEIVQDQNPDETEVGYRTLGYKYFSDLGTEDKPLRQSAQFLVGDGRPGADGAKPTQGIQLGTTVERDRGVLLHPRGTPDLGTNEAAYEATTAAAAPAVTVVGSPVLDLTGAKSPVISFNQRFDLETRDNAPQRTTAPIALADLKTSFRMDEVDVRSCVDDIRTVSPSQTTIEQTPLAEGDETDRVLVVPPTLDALKCLLDTKRATADGFSIQEEIFQDQINAPSVSAGLFLQVTPLTGPQAGQSIPVSPIDGYRYPFGDAGGYEPTLGYQVEDRAAFPGYRLPAELGTGQSTQSAYATFKSTRYDGQGVWAGDTDIDGDGEPEWVESRVDLSRFAGEKVKVEFVLVARHAGEPTSRPDSADLLSLSPQLTKAPWGIDDISVVDGESTGEVAISSLDWPNQELPRFDGETDLPVRVTATTPTGLDAPIHARAQLFDAQGCFRAEVSTRASFEDESGTVQPMPAGAELSLPEMLIPSEKITGNSPWTLEVEVDVGRTPSGEPQHTATVGLPSGSLVKHPVTEALNTQQGGHLNITTTAPGCNPEPSLLLISNGGGRPLIQEMETDDSRQVHIQLINETDPRREDNRTRLRVLDGLGDRVGFDQFFNDAPRLAAVIESNGTQDPTAAGVTRLLHDDAGETTVAVTPSQPRVPVDSPLQVDLLPASDLDQATLWAVPAAQEDPDVDAVWRGALDSGEATSVTVSLPDTGIYLLVLTGARQLDDGSRISALGGAAVTSTKATASGDPTRIDNVASLVAQEGEDTGLTVRSITVDPAQGLSTTPREVTAEIQNTGNTALDDLVVTFTNNGELATDPKTRDRILPGAVETFRIPEFLPGGDPAVVLRVDAQAGEETATSSAALRSLIPQGTLSSALDDGSDGWITTADGGVAFQDPDTGLAPVDTRGQAALTGARLEGLADVAISLDHTMDLENRFDGGRVTLTDQATGETSILDAGDAMSQMGPYSPVQGEALTGQQEANALPVALDTRTFLNGQLETLRDTDGVETLGTALLGDDEGHASSEEATEGDIEHTPTCASRTYSSEAPIAETGPRCEWSKPLIPVPKQAVDAGLWHFTPAALMNEIGQWNATLPGEDIVSFAHVLPEEVDNLETRHTGSSIALYADLDDDGQEDDGQEEGSTTERIAEFALIAQGQDIRVLEADEDPRLDLGSDWAAVVYNDDASEAPELHPNPYKGQANDAFDWDDTDGDGKFQTDEPSEAILLLPKTLPHRPQFLEFEQDGTVIGENETGAERVITKVNLDVGEQVTLADYQDPDRVAEETVCRDPVTGPYGATTSDIAELIYGPVGATGQAADDAVRPVFDEATGQVGGVQGQVNGSLNGTAAAANDSLAERYPSTLPGQAPDALGTYNETFYDLIYDRAPGPSRFYQSPAVLADGTIMVVENNRSQSTQSVAALMRILCPTETKTSERAIIYNDVINPGLDDRDASKVFGVAPKTVTQRLFLETDGDIARAAQETGSLKLTFDEARDLTVESITSGDDALEIEVCLRFLTYGEEDKGSFPALAREERRCADLGSGGTQVKQRAWGETSVVFGDIPQGTFDTVRIELGLTARTEALLDDAKAGTYQFERTFSGWYVGPVTLEAQGATQVSFEPDIEAIDHVNPATGFPASLSTTELSQRELCGNKNGDGTIGPQEGCGPRRYTKTVEQTGFVTVDEAQVTQPDGTIRIEDNVARLATGSLSPPLIGCQWWKDASTSDKATGCGFEQLYDDVAYGAHELFTVPWGLGMACWKPNDIAITYSPKGSDGTEVPCDPALDNGLGPQVLDSGVLTNDAKALEDHDVPGLPCGESDITQPLLWRSRCLHATRAKISEISGQDGVASTTGTGIRLTSADVDPAGEDEQGADGFHTPALDARGYNLDYRLVIPLDLRFASDRVWAQPLLDIEHGGQGNVKLISRLSVEARVVGAETWQTQQLCPEREASQCVPTIIEGASGTGFAGHQVNLTEFRGQRVELAVRVQAPHPTLTYGDAPGDLENMLEFNGIKVDGGFVRMVGQRMGLDAWTDPSDPEDHTGWEVKGAQLFGLPIEANVGIADFETKLNVSSSLVHLHTGVTADDEIESTIPGTLTLYNQGKQGADLTVDADLQYASSDGWVSEPGCDVALDQDTVRLASGTSKALAVNITIDDTSDEETCIVDEDVGTTNETKRRLVLAIDPATLPEDDYFNGDNQLERPVLTNPFSQRDSSLKGIHAEVTGQNGVGHEIHDRGLEILAMNATPTRPSGDDPVRISATVRLQEERTRNLDLRLELVEPQAGDGTPEEVLAVLDGSDADRSVINLPPYEPVTVNWTLEAPPTQLTLARLTASVDAANADGGALVDQGSAWFSQAPLDDFEEISAYQQIAISGEASRTSDGQGFAATVDPDDEGSDSEADQGSDPEIRAAFGSPWFELEDGPPPVVGVRARWSFPQYDDVRTPVAEAVDTNGEPVDARSGWAIQVCRVEGDARSSDCPISTSGSGSDTRWAWTTLAVQGAPQGTLGQFAEGKLTPNPNCVPPGPGSPPPNPPQACSSGAEDWASLDSGQSVLMGTSPGFQKSLRDPSGWRTVLAKGTACQGLDAGDDRPETYSDPACPIDWAGKERGYDYRFRVIAFSSPETNIRHQLTVSHITVAPVGVSYTPVQDTAGFPIPEAAKKAVPLTITQAGELGPIVTPRTDAPDGWITGFQDVEPGEPLELGTETRFEVETPINPAGTSQSALLTPTLNMTEADLRNASALIPVGTLPAQPPNLVVTDVKVDEGATKGQEVQVEARIENQGLDVSPDFPTTAVAVYDSGKVQGLTPIENDGRVGSLGPLSGSSVIYSWTPEQAGQAEIRVAADLDSQAPLARAEVTGWGLGEVPEQRECGPEICDNVGTHRVDVAPPAVADLSVHAQVLADTPLTMGETVDIKVTVENDGPATVPAFKVRLLAGVISLLKEDPLTVTEPLAPGETWSQTVELIPGTSGNLSLVATAFSDQRFVQEDRSIRSDGTPQDEDNVQMLTLPVVARGLGLTVPGGINAKSLATSDQLTLPVELENRGSEPLVVSLAARSEQGLGTIVDETGQPRGTVEIDPGRRSSGKIAVFYDGLPPAGQHQLRVEAASEAGLSARDVTVEVPKVTKLDVDPVTTTADRGKIQIPVTIHAKGNAPVTATVTAEAPGLSRTTKTVELVPGEAHNLTLESWLAQRIEGVAEGRILVTAGDVQRAAPLRIQQDTGPLTTLTAAGVQAGNQPKATATVSNLGDQSTEVNLSLVQNGEILAQQNARIAPGEDTPIELLAAPSPGRVQLVMTDTVTGKTIERNLPVGDIRPDLHILDVRHDPIAPQAGEMVTVHASIANSGKSPVTVQPGLFVDGMLHTVTADERRIEPGAVDRVTLRWEATEGEHTLVVNADPTDRVEDRSREDDALADEITVRPMGTADSVTQTVPGVPVWLILGALFVLAWVRRYQAR